MRFRDRRDAGRRLARRLKSLRAQRPVVLGLPRGGVPVAAEVAAGLGVPLDVLVVRKIGLPQQPELGVGAVGEGGVSVFDDAVLDTLGLTRADLADVVRRETREVNRRIRRYRGERPPAAMAGRTVVLVDDGVATGSTVRAAVEILRRRHADRIVVAAPVGSARAITALAGVADEVVCLQSPAYFRAIGEFYDDFAQLSDAEVIAILGTPHDMPASVAPS